MDKQTSLHQPDCLLEDHYAYLKATRATENNVTMMSFMFMPNAARVIGATRLYEIFVFLRRKLCQGLDFLVYVVQGR